MFAHKLFYTTKERKDKIEERNRMLIQKFQSQLSQQLEDLHETVATSVMQQEQQLKEMEEDMHSFVSTKTRVGMRGNYAHYLNLNFQIDKLCFDMLLEGY